MGVSASRDIASCSDRGVEKLHLSGGSFVKPSFKIQIAPNVFLGVAYTLFCPSCDFDNLISLSFSGSFGER